MRRGRDLSAFEQLTRQGAPWQERLSLIRTEFPSIDDLDWKETFLVDVELMGRLIRDLLKAGLRASKTNGRSGPRKSPEYDAGMQELRDLFGLDFSVASFAQSFSDLIIEENHNQVAQRTGLASGRVRALVQGDEKPTVWEIVQVANAYGKRPGYFTDYRTLFIASAIAAELDRNPEWSMGLYRQIRGGTL